MANPIPNDGHSIPGPVRRLVGEISNFPSNGKPVIVGTPEQGPACAGWAEVSTAMGTAAAATIVADTARRAFMSCPFLVDVSIDRRDKTGQSPGV
nr:hypothetical protein Ade03nite_20770 [Actinoplanes derwentensis]